MRHTPCRCRSACLIEVRSNFRLPIVPTNAASAAMPLFRTQSAAEQTSLAPHDSKARLQSVTTRRKFMAKPCTPHLHCAARAALRALNCQCAGSRGKAPRPFSWGCKGDILFREREYPPLTRSHTVWGTTMQRCRAAIKTPLRGEGAKKGSLSAADFFSPPCA